MVLSWMVLHMGHIDLNRHAHQGHNQGQNSPLIQ